MSSILKNPIVMQLLKWCVVLLVGCLGLVLKQYGTTQHIDLPALALHVAAELDKLAVGGFFGWMLAQRPAFMALRRPPEYYEERLE